MFASSDNPTELRQSFVVLNYSTSTFLPNQAAIGNGSIVSQAGTIATDYPDYLPAMTNEAPNTVGILIGSASEPNLGEEYVSIGEVPVPLVRLEFKTQNCNANPMIAFDELVMQGGSYFHDEASLPFLIMAYSNVIASDMEQVHPCGCANVSIDSFSPEEIVAGDNQVLTITGTGFGVFQRGSNPGEGGNGSSVLFKNGDYTGLAGDPNDKFMAVAKADFDINGVLCWSDTEIKVKIPSTDYRQGVNGPASTGRFIVRNGCNDEDKTGLLEIIKIPYSKTNFRLANDGKAKRLGLRNDNGVAGEQDGYIFEFHPNVDAINNNMNIDIKDAFDEALSIWCNATNIRFKRKLVNGPLSVLAANDGRNTILIGSLGNPNAQAALVQGQAYFPIDCEESDDMDEDGGFIMTDLDFIVQSDFAIGNDQSRAIRVFTHELGHAHILNHARCFGTLCGGPLMHPQATTGIKAVDIDGGNKIFGDSEDIILNGCQQGGSIIVPVKIQQGGCGTIVATEEHLLVGVKLFPNPTYAAVSILGLDTSTRYSLWNMAGQQIAAGEICTTPYQLEMSAYPPGTYLLSVTNKEKVLATIKS